MKRYALTLLCWIAFAANLVAEPNATLDRVEVVMLGAAGTVHQVEIVSETNTGITISSAGHDGMTGRIGPLARWFEEPILTYHSREVGQIGMVQYDVGGGTGFSDKRYFAFCCTENGCQVVHEGFARQHSISVATPRSNYDLASEFRAIPDGFAQLVRLDRPVQTQFRSDRLGRYDSIGPVELRFHIDRGDKGLVTVREIDSNSAYALLAFIEVGLPTPREWAAGVLEEQWPELEEPLTAYLDSPAGEQSEQIEILRARLDQILSDEID